MERDAQKAVEGRAVRPARERARDPIAPLPGVAHLGHERECILVAPEPGLEAGAFETNSSTVAKAPGRSTPA